MKTVCGRFSFFSLVATFAMLCLSWTPVRQYKGTVFARFLETETTSTHAAIAETGNVRDFLSLQWLHAKKKKYNVPDQGIHWTVIETGAPYRDANLKLSLDGNQIAFEYWNTTNSYPFIWDNKIHHDLRVECPILLQWATIGDYHLKVTEKWDDGLGNIYTTVLYDETWQYSSSDTPANPSFDETFDVTEGNAYYITIQAKIRPIRP
jgi:hypothetical protein